MDLTINFNNITEAQAITLVKAAKIMEQIRTAIELGMPQSENKENLGE